VEAVGDRPENERDAVWKVMTGVTDDRVLDAEYERRVRAGLARFVKPMDLERLGFEDYLRDVPKVIRRNYEELDSGKVTGFHPTYAGSWGGTGMALNNQFLSLMISEAGADFDYVSALKKIEFEANSGTMFGRSEEEMAKYRPYARVVFAVIAALVILFVVLIVRSMFADREGTTQAVYRGWLPWAMLLPALILVGLWGYYPLFRGLVMALQDYRIAGESPFVGLDNFINLALDNSFWASMGRTFYFVALNVVLAFLSPILLAILLSEVPQGKVFFRTLFFLPQVTSGLVIALLWKLMYDPTPQGFFNQMIAILNQVPFVEIPVQSWLQDPRLAMICCVIPTVWASMGMASLIYLAALKSVPEEIYEAADVDGAGMFGKLRRITLPTLMPLIIINFVGTFVATFQNMGNIFLLTFGGPGEATMVVGMRIWIEAYNNLRFSVATSMAWVLGAVLIAFTYFQIRFLRRVEFKRAEWD
jgi:ABC-type sugar transport system permease subunit